MKDFIDKKILNIIKELKANGYQAYIVGGAVRDFLMGEHPKDWDIATSAMPDEVLNIFKDYKTNAVGKSFLVVLVDGIEVATFRKDRYFGESDKNCEIAPATTIEEDLARRDFTINAMAYDPETGVIIDPFDGYADIMRKLVWFVGNADDRIWEDPNRIIRAFRFAAKIDGELDYYSLRAIKRNLHLFDKIAPERIRLEILKAMKIKKASKFFKLLEEVSILEKIFPSLHKCYKHPHGKYHVEDVFEHSMLVGDNISTKYPLLKLAGYLHDCGKPDTYDEKSFHNHEDVGAGLASDELRKLRFSEDEIKYIAGLILLHMRFARGTGPRGIRHLISDAKYFDLHYKDLLRINIADRNGKKRENVSVWEIMKRVKNFKYEAERKDAVHAYADLKLDGNNVMEVLNIPAGKKVGELLKYLYDKVLDDPELNTKDNLTKLLKEKK
jgi:tRNA nucleotidyltransferase/poly(A) polymerase